jgi:aspartate oxidase
MHDVSDSGFRLRFQVEFIQFHPTEIDSLRRVLNKRQSDG